MRQGRLAQAGRAEYEHMVEGFAPAAGGLDEDLHLLTNRLLADEVLQPGGPNRAIDQIVLATGGGGDQTIRFYHGRVPVAQFIYPGTAALIG